MAKRLLTDAVITLDGTDVSQYCSQVSVETASAEVPLKAWHSNTAFSGAGEVTVGIAASFFSDAEVLDPLLYDLWESRRRFTVAVRESSDAAGTLNPEYSITAWLPSYVPIGGQVGGAATVDVTFPNAHPDGLQRATF